MAVPGWPRCARRRGLDFKGRHHLFFHPEDAEEEGFELLDVRWNSQGTAERTLATMSAVGASEETSVGPRTWE